MTRSWTVMMSRFLSVVLIGFALSAEAAGQMPDISQMSGVPLPTGDLPTGTISVRVVRGDLSNNVVGQAVELHGGGPALRAATDDTGRAQFAGVAPGTRVHAVATVDGRRLESQEFEVPAAGGIRVILVAGGSGAAAGGAPGGGGGAQVPATPAQPGTVALAGQSRFVLEMADEAIDVYYLLDIANVSSAPVEPKTPLVFELPVGARGATVLEGSSPRGKAEEGRFAVSGPFAPGVTTVQLAYQLPYAGATLAFSQALPAPLSQTTIVVRKVGALQFRSPQVTGAREVASDGQTYVTANGPGVPAGGTVSFELSGLPYHSRIPRRVALALAALVAAIGAWLSVRVPAGTGRPQRAALEARREHLLAELVKLEEQHRAGRGDDRKYAARRGDLVARLERVYGELDDLDGDQAGAGASGAAPEPAR